MRRRAALFALLTIGCVAFAASSPARAEGTVTFRPGLPDDPAAGRLRLRNPQTTTIPLRDSTKRLPVLWAKDEAGDDALWIVLELPEGGTELRSVSLQVSDSGTRATRVSLPLRADSGVLTGLDLRLLPSTRELRYRWSKTMLSTAEAGSVLRGKPLPPFALRELGSTVETPFASSSALVVINSWTTSCGPCVAEMPSLNELVAKWSPRGVRFVAIAQDSPERVTRFFASHEFRFHQTLGTESSAAVFGLTYPRHVLLGRDGRVQFDVVGGSPQIAKRLDAALARAMHE